MRKFLFLITLPALLLTSAITGCSSIMDTFGEDIVRLDAIPEELHYPADYTDIYMEAGLDEFISYDVFEKAMAGYGRITGKKKEVLTFIDFTKPSSEERLYVIDVAESKILFRTHVAHGRNSGEKFATSFSNVNGSFQSSLGFYLTSSTYHGKSGYSMRLDGLEKGINDMARDRAIVMHGSKYSTPAFLKTNGKLGRSLGCPAIPKEFNKPIIDKIKDGSVLFIYAEDPVYLAQSSFID